ncbi:MAG: hypothetical protein DI601_00355 [Azospirillum brasilense]|nr:MAG: hypothetical protein DI601_00355 [Azospirillum brasilense]
MIALKGHTWPHRDAIVEAGGVYDREKGAWFVPEAEHSRLQYLAKSAARRRTELQAKVQRIIEHVIRYGTPMRGPDEDRRVSLWGCVWGIEAPMPGEPWLPSNKGVWRQVIWTGDMLVVTEDGYSRDPDAPIHGWYLTVTAADILQDMAAVYDGSGAGDLPQQPRQFIYW